MADIFASEGIEPPKDIFAAEGIAPPVDIFAQEGIAPPTIKERNKAALSPALLKDAPEDVQQNFKYDEDSYELLARSRFSEAQIKAIKDKGPIGFLEARKFLSYQDVLPAGGIYQAADTITILSAANKLESGEELSVNEETVLNSFIDKQVEMNLRGMKIGGGISYYGSQMPAFMVEFLLTAGVGKTAQKVTQEAAQDVIERVVKRQVSSKLAAKTAGLTANVAARTAAMPAMYTPQYGELRVNNYMGITDKGDILLKDGDESPAVSALKAFAYTGAEVASELSGAAIGKYIVRPAGQAIGKLARPVMSKAFDAIPVKTQQALYQAYKGIKPNAKISEVFTTAGWNGMLEELGEERVADILRGSLNLAADKDYTMDDFLDEITPDKDQLLIEAGIITIAGGVKASANIATNILMSKGMPEPQAQDAVENMSALEQENLISKETQIAPTITAETEVDNLSPIETAQAEAAQQQNPPDIITEESTFDALYRDFGDALDPIKKLVQGAQEAGQPATGTDAYTLARTYAGIIGNIRHNLEYGTTQFNPETGQMEVNGKGFKSILSDFDNVAFSVEPKQEQRQADLFDYMIARRTLEDLQAREDVMVAEKDLIKGAEDMARLADKYGEKFEWFDTIAQELYEYQRRILSNLVGSGVMSQEQYDTILKENPNYIPFQRVLDDEGYVGAITSKGVFTDANAKKVIKKIHGSDKEIKNPAQSIIANTAKIIDLAYRNRVALGIADMADVMPEYVQKVKTPMQKFVVDGETVYRPSQIAPRGTITVFRDGKKQYYKVSPAILKAVESMTPEERSAAHYLMNLLFYTPARMVRAGATLVPEFWIRNVMRDQMTAVIQSEVRPTPIDFIKGITAVMGKTELYKEWERSGGSFNSYMELDDKGLEKAYKELLSPKGKLARYLTNPINVLADISGALEQATRIGVFGKARRNGVSGLEAALISREATLDFARGGRTSKKINKYVPFFNAGVQSVDKMVRTFKEHPIATTMWGLGTITAPSIILTGYYLYGAPEEERQEYLEIPQWQKDLFWVFKQDGEWRRVPKPFSFGYLFGSIPERFMIWGYQGDKPEMKKFWEELAYGIAGTVSPVYDPSALLPPLVKTSIEGITNYNFFTGRNIYPEWMDRYEAKFRYNKYTSETSKAIGDKFNISPAVIDNTIRGVLATSSNYVMDASDRIVNEVKSWSGEEIPENPLTPSDRHIIKAFSVREPTGYQANSVSNFFDTWQELNEVNASFRSREGDEKADYLDQNEKKIAAYKGIKPFYEKIIDLGKMSDAVYEDLDMTSEEKVKELSEIGDLILETAKEANDFFKDFMED